MYYLGRLKESHNFDGSCYTKHLKCGTASLYYMCILSTYVILNHTIRRRIFKFFHQKIKGRSFHVLINNSLSPTAGERIERTISKCTHKRKSKPIQQKQKMVKEIRIKEEKLREKMHEKALELRKIMFKSPKSRLSAAKMYKSKSEPIKSSRFLLTLGKSIVIAFFSYVTLCSIPLAIFLFFSFFQTKFFVSYYFHFTSQNVTLKRKY